MAYWSYVGKVVNRKEKITHPTCSQCLFGKTFFAKSAKAMKKNTRIWAAEEGVTYTFDNGHIISFQDNFRYMGDVLFTVYLVLRQLRVTLFFLTQKCKLYPTVRYMLFIRA